jgi:hypothetical protein
MNTEAHWDTANPNIDLPEIFSEQDRPNVYNLIENKNERFVPAKVDEWMARIGKTA